MGGTHTKPVGCGYKRNKKRFIFIQWRIYGIALYLNL